MQLGWSRTRFSPIAVDFGADSVKLLQIIAEDPPRLVAAASVALQDEARTALAARKALLPEALRELLASQPFRGRRAICSIPAPQTIVQNFQIAGGDEVDLTAQVEQQLRQHLNVEPSRMVVRAVAAPAPPSAGRQPVVCVAVARELVMRYVQIARRARLDVVGMHCEPLALVKAFRHLYRRKDDVNRTTAFLDIGAATTKFVITHGTDVVVARIIHVGGDHFVREHAAAVGSTFAEARTARMAACAVPDRVPSVAAAPVLAEARAGGGAHDAGGGVAAAERRGDVDPFLATGAATVVDAGPGAAAGLESTGPAGGEALECLVDELKLCLRYHCQAFPDRPLEKVIFLGGESCGGHLCGLVAQSIGIDARRGDPLARLHRHAETKGPPGVDLRRTQPGWAVPMGLCLSETNL